MVQFGDRKKVNLGDMWKIYVTWPFFEASGCHPDFFKKTKKKTFLDKVYGSMCTKFQVCIVFFVWPGGVTKINKQIDGYSSKFRNIFDRLYSPHVDFENGAP